MDIQAILQSWLDQAAEVIPKVISAVVIFIVTIISSGFIAKWIQRITKKKITNHETLQLIFRITRWTVLVVGTIVALDQVDFDVTGFIAGLGVAGFTIGFAMQDMAKNFISGLMLLYRQPFSVGDRVGIADFKGIILDINVRDTVLETLDGEKVIIPNQEVFENPIVNYTDTKFRRREVIIGLGYEQDSQRAIRIFIEAIGNVPGVGAEPAPTVRAEALGDSTLTLSALFWVDHHAHNLFEVHSDVVQAIKEAAEEYQINLPYPIQTVWLKQ
jgi:small-conductance mechanosensitive channel